MREDDHEPAGPPAPDPGPQAPPGADPGPGVDPAGFVRMALPFYGGLLAVAWLWRSAWLGEPLLYAGPAAAEAGVDPARDLLVGLLAGALVIAISHQLTVHLASGRALARAMASLLGPLELRHVVVLALLSGVAEEAFFRGALQPRVGWVVASLLFGFVHYVPRPEFRLWTLTSVAAGFWLGFLFEATGNLVAPVVAHALINGVNLSWLVRGGPWDEEPRGA